MIYKKFEQDDLLYNKIIVNPKVKIFIKDQKTYFKNINPTTENIDYANQKNLPPIPLHVYLSSIRTQKYFTGCEPSFDFSCEDNAMYIAAI